MSKPSRDENCYQIQSGIIIFILSCSQLNQTFIYSCRSKMQQLHISLMYFLCILNRINTSRINHSCLRVYLSTESMGVEIRQLIVYHHLLNTDQHDLLKMSKGLNWPPRPNIFIRKTFLTFKNLIDFLRKWKYVLFNPLRCG